MANKKKTITMEEYTPITVGEAFSKGYKEGLKFNEEVTERKHLIATRLKELRFKRKVSQSKLCEEININRITYAGYEAERAEPRAEVFVRLADFYGVSVDYLVCRTDNPKDIFATTETKTKTQTDIDELMARVKALEEKSDK